MESGRHGVAVAGETLENPVSGQRIVFRKTAEETGGKLLEVEALYEKATPSRPPVHYHPYQRERFEVLSGRLEVLLGGERRTLEEGEVLTVEPGTPHSMWAEKAGVRVNWQTRPAMKTAAFFETLWGLARDGETDERGAPNLLQMAVIAREFADEFRLASPPWPAQRALFAVLAPVGRLAGYQRNP